LTVAAFSIGYGRGEIEPKIAPLVEAVRAARFVTFSSCEGHLEGGTNNLSRPTCVGFYASEAEAKSVHVALHGYRDRLRCSWVLGAGFVAHRESNEWVLGWTLENWGIIERGPDDTFGKRTLEAAWDHDIPLLIEMLSAIRPI
jgi:hypothetical protein